MKHFIVLIGIIIIIIIIYCIKVNIEQYFTQILG